MNIEEKEQVKEHILEQISELKKELMEIEEKIKPIEPDCALGDLTRFEMMNEQDVFYKAFEAAKTRLGRLQYLLRTIDDNTEYGSCEECGDDILFERLLILPESKFCTHCATKL